MKIQNEVSACFYHLLIVKLLPVTLQKASSGFLTAACSFKSCSEIRLWFWELFRKPAMSVHLKKFTSESKGKPGQKFDAAFGTTSSVYLDN